MAEHESRAASDDLDEVKRRLVASITILANERAAINRRNKLMLRAWEMGLTHAQIGKLCNVTRGTVTMAISQARKAS